MATVEVTRTAPRLAPDARRVLAKPHIPGDEILLAGPSRAGALIRRLLAIPEPAVAGLLADVRARFGDRHHGFDELLARHFALVAHHVDPSMQPPSPDRRLLIGAYFTQEYAVEAAALFNPSIVVAPDQDGLAAGTRRFVMSLRAVGEGHLSSIEFRAGVVDGAGGLTFDPPSSFLVGGQRVAPGRYDRNLFSVKLVELGVGNQMAWSVLDRVPEQFTIGELERSLATLEATGTAPAIRFETVNTIRALAASNYVTSFPPDSLIGERVLFPAGPHETRGMEDARFVRFVEDDGAATYYATYTAYDGFGVLPQLIQTHDFVTFTIATLNGAAARNKGMALFPRKIDGRYVMLSRQDRESLYLATSSNVRFWDDVSELYGPAEPWELLQIGNCGSPIETADGWLVITHGTGPMRQYALGAILLDLADPRRVIGRLREPLLVPDASEREGYVPNVVYTCGALVDGERLVLPYGCADHGIRVATLSLPALLDALRAAGA